jgi:hypothetical protein
MPITFQPATKAGTRARVALIGPPSSGKTYTSLILARAFGGTTGLIDTERRTARKYADEFDFQWHGWSGEYAPELLTGAVLDSAEAGIDTLIIDGGSPFWSGAGGMLEQVDRATARAGRSDKFGSGWNEMRPVERQMLDALASYPGHLILTLRTKIEWVLERNDQTGKWGPRRVGTKPDQREGIEYDFDVVADMDDHGSSMTFAKSAVPELPGGTVVHKPTDAVGFAIIKWLEADAVGEPFNPLTVRDWALAGGRTVEELGERYRELEAAGAVGAIVRVGAAGGAGTQVTTIGEFLRQRGHEILRDAKRAAA